jgi:hypothetical protein
MTPNSSRWKFLVDERESSILIILRVCGAMIPRRLAEIVGGTLSVWNNLAEIPLSRPK